MGLIDLFERKYIVSIIYCADENEAFGLNDINTKDFESGVDAATYYGHILPDRITHKAVRRCVIFSQPSIEISQSFAGSWPRSSHLLCEGSG